MTTESNQEPIDIILKRLVEEVKEVNKGKEYELKNFQKSISSLEDITKNSSEEIIQIKQELEKSILNLQTTTKDSSTEINQIKQGLEKMETKIDKGFEELREGIKDVGNKILPAIDRIEDRLTNANSPLAKREQISDLLSRISKVEGMLSISLVALFFSLITIVVAIMLTKSQQPTNQKPTNQQSINQKSKTSFLNVIIGEKNLKLKILISAYHPTIATF